MPSSVVKILFIGIGGIIGAVSRYLIGGWVHRVLNEPWLPYGTFVVNMIGCLFIGLLMGFAESRRFMTPEVRLFLVTGFLGSLTTFSTFAYESASLLRDGELLSAFANIGVQVIAGLFLVYLGLIVSRVF